MRNARSVAGRDLVAASSVPAAVASAGIRKIAACGAITLNAATKVLDEDHQDHERQSPANGQGLA